MLSTLLRTLQIGFQLAHIQNKVQENAGRTATTVVTKGYSPESYWFTARVCVSASRHDGRTPQSGSEPGPTQAGTA